MCQGLQISPCSQFRPSEIHCQPDPIERNGSLRHVTTRYVFKSFRKATLESGLGHLCYFCLVLLCFRARPFINALWSPARKGLTH